MSMEHRPTRSGLLRSTRLSAFFGRSVGTAGDVDGDGYADVIVGADLWDNGETNEGGAAIYRGSSVGLDATAMWAQEGNQAAADYGWSVATAGDVNGDGYADVIVGAHGYTNPESGEGRACRLPWLCQRPDGDTPVGADRATRPAPISAYSVGTAGDVNGDGYADVVVGATWYDGGLTNEGRAYVYYGHGAAAGLSLTAARTLECNVAGAQFGFSVGTAGDVNGDGYDDVIIGADEYDDGSVEWRRRGSLRLLWLGRRAGSHLRLDGRGQPAGCESGVLGRHSRGCQR